MGELVRLVLEDCVEEGLLFSGLNTAQLHIPGTFPTKDLSQYQQTEAMSEQRLYDPFGII